MQDDHAVTAGPGHPRWAPRVRGRVQLPADCDETQVLDYVMADLRRRGCKVRMARGGIVAVESSSEGRGSVLAFVDGGTLRLDRCDAALVMDYAFSTTGSLLLCAILSPVCGGLGWFALGSPGLAVFGLLGPLAWLYGANYVLTAARVPALLDGLCRAAPRRSSSPWDKPG